MNHEKELLNFHLLEAITDEEEVMVANSSSKTTSSTSNPGTTWAKDGDKIPNQVLEWSWEEIDTELLALEETKNTGDHATMNILKFHCQEQAPALRKHPFFLKEAHIEAKVGDPLLSYICSVVSNGEDKLKTIYKGAGNPDIVIKNNRVTIIVGEIKTFWSYKFDESTNHLADMWTAGTAIVDGTTSTRHDYYMSRALSGLQQDKSEGVQKQYSLESKVFHLVIQHFREMSENLLKYGFITTWNYWWITKQEKNGKLCISKAFKHNNGSPSILQLLGRLIKTAKSDYAFQKDVDTVFETVSLQKPVESNRPEKRAKTVESALTSGSTISDQTIISLTCHYNKVPIVKRLVEIFRAPRRDMCINEHGCVVRCLMENEPDQVMKFTWIPEYPGARQIYEHECQVYERLKSLQGYVIPTMEYHHPFWFSGIGGTLAITMSYAGKYLTKDKIATLSREVREEGLRHLQQIHQLGVLHGDLRFPNIVWNEKSNRIMFIDFGLSKFIKDNDASVEVSMEINKLKTLLELAECEVENQSLNVLVAS